MDSHLQNHVRFGLVLVLAVGFTSLPRLSSADSIDLSLNLLYDNRFDPNSGGTWQLAAKSGGEGILSLVAYLQDIDQNTTQLRGPSGLMNGTDAAGFNLNVADFGSSTQVVLSQFPLNTGVGEETLFYGVGSIDDPVNGGAPNYADQAPGSVSIGPQYNTLTNVVVNGVLNGVWGNGDVFGEAEWENAAIMAQGTFSPGDTPAFSSDSVGAVFNAVAANNTEIGTFDNNIVATTVVRDDLLTPPAADFDLNGTVGFSDYIVWRNNLGAAVSPAGSGIDLDSSGVVDAGDLALWKADFGTTVPLPSPVSSVSASLIPEPGTGALVLVFTAFLFVYGHVRRQLRSGYRSFSLISLNTKETA